MKTPKIFQQSNYKSESLGCFPLLESHISSEKHIFKSQNRDYLFTPKEKKSSQSIILKQALVQSVSSLQLQLDRPSRTKQAYKALELFVSSPTFFQRELKICLDELFTSLFCDKKLLKPQIIDWIYDKYDLSAAESDNLVPYFQLAEYLSDTLEKFERKNKELHSKIKDLKINIQEKSSEIDSLKHDFVRVLEHKNDGAEAKNQLKFALAKIMTNKESSEKKIRDLTDNIDEINNQLLFKEEEIKKREKDIAKGNQEIKILKEEIEELNSKISETHEENKKLSSFVKALIAKTKSINKDNLRLNDELRDSETKIRELFVRASGGYTSLTPRPDLSRLDNVFETNNIENSTRARSEYLMNYYIFMNAAKKRSGTTRSNTKIANT